MLLDFILRIACIFAGSWMIRDAVKDFKRGRYFFFGLDIYFALMFAVYLVMMTTAGIMW